MTRNAKETRAAMALIAALAVSTMAFAEDPYRGKIAKFRAEREAELKAEDMVVGFRIVLAQGGRESFRR